MNFVMDSAVILNNFNFAFSEDIFFTSNEVLDEIIDFRSKNLVQIGLKEGKIKVVEPKKEFLEKARKAAKELSLIHKLSKTDFSVIALAIELKFPLLSDDYHIQKVCIKLGLKFDSVLREKIG